MIWYGIYIGDALWVLVASIGTVVGWLLWTMAWEGVIKTRMEGQNGEFLGDAIEANWHERIRFFMHLVVLALGMIRLIWIPPDQHELSGWMNRPGLTTILVIFLEVCLTWKSVRAMRSREKVKDNFMKRWTGLKKTRESDG
jgi:hypothetical protein